MGYLVLTALVILAIIYGLIVSRGFRILAVLLILGGSVWWSIASDRAEKQKATDEAVAAMDKAKEKARQSELWSRVPPNQIELRAPQLSKEPGSYSPVGEFRLTGSIKNLSNQALSGFEIDVVARDCTSVCETIGHSTDVVWVDIPAQEVRGISGKVTLSDLPPLRGKLVPQFTVKSVYAGDFLDQWSAR